MMLWVAQSSYHLSSTIC